MIKRVKYAGLNRRFSGELQLHDDMNVLTGMNGCGKTTILKLLWLATSCNVDKIFHEILFDRVEIETDSYLLSGATSTGDSGRPKVDWVLRAGAVVINGESDRTQEINAHMLKSKAGSLFFPTFRRLEGGFGMGRRAFGDDFDVGSSQSEVARRIAERGDQIQTALTSLAGQMSVGQHRFIASISTHDISEMLTGKYASISVVINDAHRVLSQNIASLIAAYEPDTKRKLTPEAAQVVLDDISTLVTAHKDMQEMQLKPITGLSNLITEVYAEKGIKLGSDLILGQATDAIASDALSAGEKQMLSFVAFNAFTQGAVIFIDEPETSLHVDWQRRLFPILLNQNSGNQFVVATHSLFIYAKYKDKEFPLS